jgi:hypothetical protein
MLRDMDMQVTMLSSDVAQLYVPIVFTIGMPRHDAQRGGERR